MPNSLIFSKLYWAKVVFNLGERIKTCGKRKN